MKKVTYYLVRLRSSRGTDWCFCLYFPTGTPRKDIRRGVEHFTDQQVLGTAVYEYNVSWQRVTMLSRSVLLAKQKIANARYEKAKQKFDEMINVIDTLPRSMGKKLELVYDRLARAKAHRQKINAMLNAKPNGWIGFQEIRN